jgi:hypothetical protein
MDKWYCIDNVNLTYAYGELDRYNLVNNVKAKVSRIEDGSWNWQASSFISILPYNSGNEPSRELAQLAAEKNLRGEWQ